MKTKKISILKINGKKSNPMWKKDAPTTNRVHTRKQAPSSIDSTTPDIVEPYANNFKTASLNLKDISHALNPPPPAFFLPLCLSLCVGFPMLFIYLLWPVFVFRKIKSLIFSFLICEKNYLLCMRCKLVGKETRLVTVIFGVTIRLNLLRDEGAWYLFTEPI